MRKWQEQKNKDDLDHQEKTREWQIKKDQDDLVRQEKRENSEKERQDKMMTLQAESVELQKGMNIPLQPLTEKDDVDAYITQFERIATMNKWDKSMWATRIVSLLQGKPRDAIMRMEPIEVADYDKVKTTLFQHFRLGADEYRKKFRAMRKDAEETFDQLLGRLKTCLTRWCVAANCNEDNAKELKDLFIQEQMYSQLSPDLTVDVRRAEPKTVEEVASEATKIAKAKQAGREIEMERKRQKAASQASTEAVEQRPFAPLHTAGRGSINQSSRPTTVPTHRGGFQRGGGDMGQRRSECYKCGQNGHLARHCTAPAATHRSPYAAYLVRTEQEDRERQERKVKEEEERQYQEEKEEEHMERKKREKEYRNEKRECLERENKSKQEERERREKELVDRKHLQKERRGNIDRDNARKRKREGKTKTLTYADLDITPEELGELQKQDSSLYREKEAYESGTKKMCKHGEISYIWENGIFLRKLVAGKTETTQVVVPQELRTPVITLAHNSSVAGHLSNQKTRDRIFPHFFWPGMYGEIRRFCASCVRCRKTAHIGRARKIPLMRMSPATPVQRIGVDLVDPRILKCYNCNRVFQVEVIPGKDNVGADYLSRLED